MRLFLIAALLIAGAAVSTAAETTATAVSTARTSTVKTARKKKKPDHWHARVKQISAEVNALPPDTSNTVVLLGDSITERFKNSHDIHELAGHKVINEGIGGDQIARSNAKTGVIYRIPLVAKAKPSAVFVMIGTNDFGTGKKSVEQVLPQYNHMLQLLRAAVPNARIIVVSDFPTVGRGDRNQKIVALNAKLPELAKEVHGEYLDMYSKLVDSEGNLKAEYSIDGVHPKPPVYDIWIEAMKQKLEEKPAGGSAAATKEKKPDYWHMRLAEITAAVNALPAETSDTIVLLGDSITEQFRINRDIHELSGHTVVNEGIGGDTITGVMNRLDMVSKAKPAVVFLMIGINDFWGTQTAQESAVQYRALLKELREKLPAAQIVVESLFPTLNKEEVNKKVVELNKMLPDLAKSINADYLDVYSKLVDVKGDLKAEYSRDGVHLKPPAYDVWIDTMKTKLSDAKK